MNRENMIQAYAPDKQKLAELVIKAKGPNRTMAQFATDTGISAPTLSRIANGKINNPLSLDILDKIYTHRCLEADFSFSMLQMANGMVDPQVVERGKGYVERFASIQEQGIALERHAKNAIINAVMDRGVVVQSIPSDFNNRRNETPFGIQLAYDFTLFLPDAPHQLWYFEVVNGSKRLPAGMGNVFNRAARLFLLDAWAPEFLVNQKTSFVFEHRAPYEQFILRFKEAPIQSAVSAILIDVSTETVLEETWMSQAPESPSIFAREVVDYGEIAAWADDEFEDQLFDLLGIDTGTDTGHEPPHRTETNNDEN